MAPGGIVNVVKFWPCKACWLVVEKENTCSKLPRLVELDPSPSINIDWYLNLVVVASLVLVTV